MISINPSREFSSAALSGPLCANQYVSPNFLSTCLKLRLTKHNGVLNASLKVCGNQARQKTPQTYLNCNPINLILAALPCAYPSPFMIIVG